MAFALKPKLADASTREFKAKIKRKEQAVSNALIVLELMYQT